LRSSSKKTAENLTPATSGGKDIDKIDEALDRFNNVVSNNL